MRTLVAALIGCALSMSVAHAQDAGATVATSVGVTDLETRTEPTFTGSAGYRFNRSIGIEVEVTAIPTLKAPYPTTGLVTIQSGTVVPAAVAPSIAIFPGPTYTNADGRSVFFTNNIRVEIPTVISRVTPYFVAGGGVATVRNTADVAYSIGILPPTPLVGGTPGIRTVTEPVSTSSTDLALTIGGGASIRIASHATIDGDLRFFRVLGATDVNAGRFALGVRYRF